MFTGGTIWLLTHGHMSAGFTWCFPAIQVLGVWVLSVYSGGFHLTAKSSPFGGGSEDSPVQKSSGNLRGIP